MSWKARNVFTRYRFSIYDHEVLNDDPNVILCFHLSLSFVRDGVFGGDDMAVVA